jgi:hypothetical protein
MKCISVYLNDFLLFHYYLVNDFFTNDSSGGDVVEFDRWWDGGSWHIENRSTGLCV